MKILVTGASGFIGGKIVEILSNDLQNQIIATGRSFTNKFNYYSNVSYFQQDLSKTIPEQNCDICIHCAGLADDQSTEKQFHKNNCAATENLLSVLTNCKLFIFISSASVYNFSDGKTKKEEDTDVTKPISLYGKSKLLSEAIVKSSAINSVYILRPRAVYGQGDRVLLPRILRLIKMNRMIIPSMLSSKTSLTHINNICEIVKKSMQQSKDGIHVFNIADKVEYDLKLVFTEILIKKTASKKIIQIPTTLIKFFVFINSLLGRKTNISQQSLEYITQNSLLNIKKAEVELDYRGEYNFLNSLKHLDL